MDEAAVPVKATALVIQAVHAVGDRIWDAPADASVDAGSAVARRVLAILLGRAEDGRADAGERRAAGAPPSEVAWTRIAVEYAVDELIQAPGDEEAQREVESAVGRSLSASGGGVVRQVSELLERASDGLASAEADVVKRQWSAASDP